MNLTRRLIKTKNFLLLPLLAMSISATPVNAQPANTALTIRADLQEANSKTGVVTAKGNVQMSYPARQIVATSAQAQYFSQERRIVLSGNVVVTQLGNSIKAETITYLLDEGKFEAVPQSNRQVESTYVVPDDNTTNAPVAATTPVKEVKPAFKNLVSPTVPATVPSSTTITPPTSDAVKPRSTSETTEPQK